MQTCTKLRASFSPLYIILIVMAIVCASCHNKPKEVANIKTATTKEAKPKNLNKISSYAEATQKLSTTEKIGQLFMPAAYINDTEEEIVKLEQLIKEQNIGALCFFKSRISAAANYDAKNKNDTLSLSKLKSLIKRYQKAAKYPLLIAIDAEWGLAMRVDNTPQYPYAITLGAMQNKDSLIYEVGKNIAKDCKEAGIHWNLAPVVDINNNPNNPVIGYRSYGENKELVTKNAIAFVNGMQNQGIISCLKHFPGHGDTATDSHIGLPVINKSKEALLANELYPFQQLINNGVESVMIGHLAVPALTEEKNTPTTLSKKTIKGLLRGEMNFNNVVISDALNMKSVSKLYPVKGELEWIAFDAGNDVLCFAENPKEGIATILKNATKQQIEESFKRVWQLKEKAMNIVISPSKSYYTAKSLNTKLATESLTVVKGNNNTISNFKSDGFVGIEITNNKENPFFYTVKEELKFTSYNTTKTTISKIKEAVKTEENVVIALYPPSIKPKNNFGISNNELELLTNLMTTKNVILYVFGNPYVLTKLDTSNAKNVIVAYQNFPVFQENAAEHFLNKVDAKGKLSVSIN
ncbi:glycoside hydrolase family 3 protein [Cellulophaga omnivescoria]|uniref:glycoside hydrolase family 3 protein n=1 Tax=Cellulophaga omnivescoria TaxID=1888890 RepID=UPI0022F0EF9E|nr:glycoside hydrolase family 3 N-terminal domain-containing protein [Cellulophaga omnivescoria]WBU89648.1 glycoside hydrolase family 3 protein [Cellulophaga omnivescoria]WKB81672.1 glycoside hydrolase family 3 N-terminal domain-containing protein [Cellulophaga lytica]